MHPLDNPMWSSLTTRHAHLALGDDYAKRYPREITTIAAFASLTPVQEESWSSLKKLAELQETIAVLFKTEPHPPGGWEVVRRVAIVQMVHDQKTFSEPEQGVNYVRLGAAEAGEIVELAKLTNPGPIGMRSHEIGDFIGIRNGDGQLIAMAGERFRFPGYSEISGVCTRPGFEGRGLAAALVMSVMKRIVARGEVPFLHSRAENARAVKLYERLGFVIQRDFPMAILRRL